MPVRKARERGFALVLVLWSLVLLTLVTSRLMAGGREDARLAANLRSGAVAEAVADAAVQETVFHLLDQSHAGWRPGPAVRRLTLPGGTALVRIDDQAGLVNPNVASEALLAALLRGVGADSGTARNVAAAILDWRSPSVQARPNGAKAGEYRAAGRDYGPPGEPFRSISELRLVLGMTRPLLDRLSPHLTLAFDGDPDATLADPVVLQALRAATGQQDLGGGGTGGVRTVAIVAAADGDGGGRFVRRAVVRTAPAADGRPFQVLDWRRVED